MGLGTTPSFEHIHITVSQMVTTSDKEKQAFLMEVVCCAYPDNGS